MSLAVALLTTSLVAAAAEPAPRAPNDACTTRAPTPAAQDAAAQAPGAKRLDEMPPHRHFMTVLRKERGCDVAVVRENGRNRIVPLPDQQGMQPLETRSR